MQINSNSVQWSPTRRAGNGFIARLQRRPGGSQPPGEPLRTHRQRQEAYHRFNPIRPNSRKATAPARAAPLAETRITLPSSTVHTGQQFIPRESKKILMYKMFTREKKMHPRARMQAFFQSKRDENVPQPGLTQHDDTASLFERNRNGPRNVCRINLKPFSY